MTISGIKFSYIPQTEKHIIKCFCGLYNTFNSIKRWWNGEPMCECGNIIKNAPQEWKKGQ
jgi:hypothetical protein